jgi:hypothetical protein
MTVEGSHGQFENSAGSNSDRIDFHTDANPKGIGWRFAKTTPVGFSDRGVH